MKENVIHMQLYYLLRKIKHAFYNVRLHLCALSLKEIRVNTRRRVIAHKNAFISDILPIMSRSMVNIVKNWCSQNLLIYVVGKPSCHCNGYLCTYFHIFWQYHLVLRWFHICTFRAEKCLGRYSLHKSTYQLMERKVTYSRGPFKHGQM